jgi:hypothetical protein
MLATCDDTKKKNSVLLISWQNKELSLVLFVCSQSSILARLSSTSDCSRRGCVQKAKRYMVRWTVRTQDRQKETRSDGEGLDSGRLIPSDHRRFRVKGLSTSVGSIGPLSMVDVGPGQYI